MADFAIEFGKVAIFYLGVIQVVPIMLWVERKGAALIQDRPGPERVGPWGLFQPVADVVKFFFKEDPIPETVHKPLFVAGPFMILIPASLAIAAIPFGNYIELFGRQIALQISTMNVGFLYLLSISSLGVYGILFGGWASNNKFSLMGAMRAASQVISYEIPMGLAAANAVLVYGSLDFRDMVNQQAGNLITFLPNWGVFYQPVGFFVFFIAAFAETNRLPFDLPEAEPELVGGYHTEYGALRFASYMMAEYINMFTSSAIMVTIFFGGWQLPWLGTSQLVEMVGSWNLAALIQLGFFLAKVSVFMILFVWVRWTIPRFRFDQLMELTWKTLIPLSIVNIVVTALVMLWRS